MIQCYNYLRSLLADYVATWDHHDRFVVSSISLRLVRRDIRGNFDCHTFPIDPEMRISEFYSIRRTFYPVIISLLMELFDS